MNGCNLQAVTHTIIDHERSLCSCCLDCLEDIHSSFNFDPLNFSHTSDEHTTAKHAVTEREMSNTYRGHESTACAVQCAQYIQWDCVHIQYCMCTHTHRHTNIYSYTQVCTHTYSHMHMQLFTQIHACKNVTHFTDSLAHDHQRCLDLLLLLLHLPHHLQHGVNWRTALLWPGEEVEQGHLKGRLRALQTTDHEEYKIQANFFFYQ